MLAGKKVFVASGKGSSKCTGSPIRLVAPLKARQAEVPRPTATRALLYPQEGAQRPEPLHAIVEIVLQWLEPKQDGLSSM